MNKMDSSNLSVILAPNLLHAGDGADKMNASTEKRLKQQAAVVHCLIERALDFGNSSSFVIVASLINWGLNVIVKSKCL